MAKESKKRSNDKPDVSLNDELVTKLQTEVDNLTSDLQRTRADFENYVRRSDQDKASARAVGESAATLKLLPVIDNIELSISHIPDDLRENVWVKGVAQLVKNFEKSLSELGLERIDSTPGTEFDPELHDAIQIDEEADGDRELVAEELRPGYCLRGKVIRHAMVKVSRGN